MAVNVYNSIYKGSVIDGAIGVIVESQVDAGDLQVLTEVSAGAAVASKALIVDASRNISNINRLTATLLKSDYLNLKDLTADPAGTPDAGTVFFYFKNGEPYIKKNDNSVTKVRSGKEKELIFSNQTLIQFNHQLGHKYPITDIVVSDEEYEGKKEYVDANNLNVRFNNPQSGRIICRTV